MASTDVSPLAREPELLGQTVVLIGGSAGIGLETARRARSEGGDVVLTGRDPERLGERRATSTRGPPPASTPTTRYRGLSWALLALLVFGFVAILVSIPTRT